MRKILPLLFAGAFLLVSGQEAKAQLGVGFGPQLSYATGIDDEDGYIGIGARAEVSPMLLPLGFIGSFDYFFPDSPEGVDISLWQLNANVKYNLGLVLPISPYFGAGLSYMRQTTSFAGFDGSTNDTGFNILAGVGLGMLPIGAFAEGRYELRSMDDGEGGSESANQLVLSIGVLF